MALVEESSGDGSGIIATNTGQPGVAVEQADGDDITDGDDIPMHSLFFDSDDFDDDHIPDIPEDPEDPEDPDTDMDMDSWSSEGVIDRVVLTGVQNTFEDRREYYEYGCPAVDGACRGTWCVQGPPMTNRCPHVHMCPACSEVPCPMCNGIMDLIGPSEVRLFDHGEVIPWSLLDGARRWRLGVLQSWCSKP